jgi:hypothetical protein
VDGVSGVAWVGKRKGTKRKKGVGDDDGYDERRKYAAWRE